jgi:hypothetical protein
MKISALEGPLESSKLEWIARLYGAADPKYRSAAQLEHLFVRSPAGPALHAFALDGSRPVGHCAIVPMPAREGVRRLTVGKVEALVVEPAYRGRRGEEPPLAVQLRQALYALADLRGIELLHAYVRPEVGRLLDLSPIRVGRPSLVAVIQPRAVQTPRLRAAAGGIFLLQSTATAVARMVVGPEEPKPALRAPTAEDEDLVRTPPPPSGRWTVLAEDTWSWLRSAPSLRVLEVAGAGRARLLVQLPGGAGGTLQLVSWSSERPTTRSALRVLTAAHRLARKSGAGRLRFQPWLDGPRTDALALACRLLGFVRRDDFSTLYVRAREPALARPDSVAATPLLGLGF